MKKKIIAILVSLTIIVPFVITSEIFHPGNHSTAYANGDLTINWGVPSGQAIFNITNFLPGDTESRTVKVTNNASSSSRQIGLQSKKTSETLDFSQGLQITIFKDGIKIFGPKKLPEFFDATAGPDYLDFSTLSPHQSANYTFTVDFPADSGNEYKNASVVFDLTIGIAFKLPAECEGRHYENVIFGTEKNDILRGTNKNDIILGFEGNDKIDGSNGDDCIVGGPGNDVLDGSNGNDVILGNEGNDRIDGSNGNDRIYGGSGNDTIFGSNGDDKIYGEDGNDKLYGDNGDDVLIGGPGTDLDDGGLGIDTCQAETKIKCELNAP